MARCSHLLAANDTESILLQNPPPPPPPPPHLADPSYGDLRFFESFHGGANTSASIITCSCMSLDT